MNWKFLIWSKIFSSSFPFFQDWILDYLARREKIQWAHSSFFHYFKSLFLDVQFIPVFFKWRLYAIYFDMVLFLDNKTRRTGLWINVENKKWCRVFWSRCQVWIVKLGSHTQLIYPLKLRGWHQFKKNSNGPLKYTSAERVHRKIVKFTNVNHP